MLVYTISQLRSQFNGDFIVFLKRRMEETGVIPFALPKAGAMKILLRLRYRAGAGK